MSAADLPAVGALSARVHPAYPEDDTVFSERLRLYPEGCRVFGQGQAIAAYVISHPWLDLAAPALNTCLGELPAAPSTYYIHDLALSSELRGSGAGAAIVAQLADHALASGLSRMSLIAVNGSAGFWRRQGFAEVVNSRLDAKIGSYGADAVFMEKRPKVADWHPSSNEISGLYERHATAFDRERGKGLAERVWFERFRQAMPEGADILDLGCGSGEPVARYLIEAGHRVTGVDSSPTLIGLCHARFPDQTWIAGDIRKVSLARVEDQACGGLTVWLARMRAG